MITIISKFSSEITKKFVENNIIDKADYEIYKYGTELILSSAISMLILLLISIITNKIIEGILFYLVFCFMRMFCGGFHAESYLKCEISFALFYSCTLALNYILSDISGFYWIILLLYSFVIIYGLAPVENKNKPLDHSEIARYKRYSIFELLIWSAIALVMAILNCRLYHIIILTLFVVSTLILVVRMHKRGGVNYE